MDISFEKNFLAILKKTPVDDLKGFFLTFSSEELKSLVTQLTEKNEVDWLKLLHLLITNITDKTSLESVGQALTLSQLLILFQKEHLPKETLAPLLVGISPSTFMDFLQKARSQNLDFLRESLHNEPLQHHLTLITHELSQKITTLDEKVLDSNAAIETLDVKTNTQALKIALESLNEEYKAALLTLDKALQLAWISERQDLITELSDIKEKGERSKAAFLGHPKEGFFPATGLFEKLIKSLETVFGETLNDSDSSLDGLTQFSLWYPRDYWEVGLLPAYKNESQVEQEDSASVLAQAKEALCKIGLQNVGDLKKYGIYSKSLLKEYIRVNLKTVVEDGKLT